LSEAHKEVLAVSFERRTSEELERSQQRIEKLTAELEEAKANAMESSEMLYLYDELDRAEQKLSEAQKKEVLAISFERGTSEELIMRSQQIIERRTAELEECYGKLRDVVLV